jgi:hypothetical protein
MPFIYLKIYQKLYKQKIKIKKSNVSHKNKYIIIVNLKTPEKLFSYHNNYNINDNNIQLYANKAKKSLTPLNLQINNKIKNIKRPNNNMKPLLYKKCNTKNNNEESIKNNTYNNKDVVNKINRKISISSNKESLHNSINLTFKSLKEREIITKSSGIFTKDSVIRLKTQKTKDAIKAKIEKYKKIFNLIDRNHTGIISIKNLNLSVIDNDELIFLTPVLIELQKNRKNMDFKEFCIKIDRSLTAKVFLDD